MSNNVIFSIFPVQNPKTIFAFWRRYKIKKFLSSLIEVKLSEAEEYFQLTSDSECEKEVYLDLDLTSPPKFDEPFLKEWLSDDDFITLAAFCYLMRQHSDRASQFQREWLDEFYLSNQAQAKEVGEKVCSIIDEKLQAYLPPAPIAKVENINPNNDNNGTQVKLTQKDENSALNERREDEDLLKVEVVQSRETLSHFKWGFESSQAFHERMMPKYHTFRDSPNDNKDFTFASNTIKSLMHQAMRKKHPMAEAKKIIAYVAAGICLAVAVAAITYLTIQTCGLIHLAWTVPLGILGGVGGGAAAAGVVTRIVFTPSIANKICSLFPTRKNPEVQKTLNQTGAITNLF